MAKPRELREGRPEPHPPGLHLSDAFLWGNAIAHRSNLRRPMSTVAIVFISLVLYTTGFNAIRSFRAKNEKAFLDNLGVFLAFGIYFFLRLTVFK